ncbi:phosphotriesterase [Clostridiales bacterium COT073_COT-073]|nr:phosphotriesterase [Clostridiales bacterium COT073_COT-073]
MRFIRTMTGDISPEQLGFTYAHEHIVCRPPYWLEKGQDDLILDDVNKSEKEVLLAKQAGVDTIVDATAIDYGRCPQDIYHIAVNTGMQIIGTAGFNKSFLWSAKIPGENKTFSDWIECADIQELTNFVIDEVEKGMQGTAIKAGQVKFGTGYNSISPLEIKTIRAVCRAHLMTGAPIHSHTEAGTMALHQIKYLKEEGVDLHHVSFGHMDRNPDTYYHCLIADTGAFLCFDGIAKIKYAPESTRINCILELAKRGYQKQILVSGDTARKSYYRSYTHALGLPYIKEEWCSRLEIEAEQNGLNGQALIEDIFINNPRECFEFKELR